MRFIATLILALLLAVVCVALEIFLKGFAL
jgi:hypothetical protein